MKQPKKTPIAAAVEAGKNVEVVDPTLMNHWRNAEAAIAASQQTAARNAIVNLIVEKYGLSATDRINTQTGEISRAG